MAKNTIPQRHAELKVVYLFNNSHLDKPIPSLVFASWFPNSIFLNPWTYITLGITFDFLMHLAHLTQKCSVSVIVNIRFLKPFYNPPCIKHTELWIENIETKFYLQAQEDVNGTFPCNFCGKFRFFDHSETLLKNWCTKGDRINWWV